MEKEVEQGGGWEEETEGEADVAKRENKSSDICWGAGRG